MAAAIASPSAAAAVMPAPDPSQIVKNAQDAAIAQCIKDLGGKTEKFTSGVTTVDAFLTLAESERVKRAPREGGKKERVIAFITSFARKVSEYTALIDLCISVSPEAASLVWSSCKILLEVGLAYADALEKLLATFSRIGENISRFERYRNFFLTSVPMQHALGLIYADIIDISVTAAVFYSRSNIRNILGTVLRNFDSRFGDKISSFNQHKELVENEVTAAYLERSLPFFPDPKDLRVRLKGLRIWLSPPDREWNHMLLNRVDLATSRHPGTCMWFKPTLSSFLNSDSDSIMVVTGGPGVGKSTLSGWVLDELESEPDKKDRIALYFHIRHNDESKRTTFDIVRGMLAQLVESKVEMPALFERLLEIHSKSVQKHVTADSEEDLWLVFRLVAGAIGDIAIVIDGLDELVDVATGTQTLFEEFWKVADNSQAAGNTFKALFTTRPPLTTANTHARQHHIRPTDTEKDVAVTVAEKISRLEDFQSLDPKIKSDISAKVAHGAEGMFLWADLIVQELRNRQSDNDIEMILKVVPKDLDELYASILHSLDLKSEDTRRIFSWLLVVARPLRMDEIAIVLTTEAGQEKTKTRRSDIADDIRKACGPLIKIDGGFVNFVHLSLAQFMSRESFQKEHGWTVSTCHNEVAFRSLTYLSFPIEGNFHGDSPGIQLIADESTKQRFQKMAENRHLLKYSVQYWAHHLVKSSTNGDLRNTFLKEDCAGFPRYQAMAWTENILWPSTFTARAKADVFKIALEIRELLFEHAEAEVIQTRLGLAKALEESGDSERATLEFRKCWEACKELEGDEIDIAGECAKELALNLERRGLGEEAGEVYTWIWASLSELNGPADLRTISAGREAAWFHQKHRRNQESIDIYREIWEVCVDAFGAADVQSIAAGTTVARTCQFADQQSESLKVYQSIWDSVRENCDPLDPRYLGAAIDLFQSFEGCSQLQDAERFMESILKQFETAVPGSAMQALFIEAKLELVRYYKRQDKSTQSIETVLQLDDLCSVALDARATTPSFLLSVESVITEARQPGIDGTAELPMLFYKFLLKKRDSPDAVTVGVARQAALSLEHDGEKKQAREILVDCVEKCTTAGTMDVAAVQACINLGLHDQKEKSWEDATKTWELLLRGLWPKFETDSETDLPKSFLIEALDAAQKLALTHERAGQVASAKRIYQKLLLICKKRFGPGDNMSAAANSHLAGIFQRQGSISAAVELHKELYEARRLTTGASSALTIESGMQLTRLYMESKRTAEAELLYIEMLSSLERDWGRSFATSVEVALGLAGAYECQPAKHYKAQELYEGLWSLCLREKLMNAEPGKDKWKFEPGTVINLRNKLYKVYEPQRWKKSNEATKVYGELLEVFLRQGGPYERADVSIRIEVGTSWERSSRNDLATALYEKFFEEDNKNDIYSVPDLTAEIAIALARRYKKDQPGNDINGAVFSRVVDGLLADPEASDRTARLNQVLHIYKTFVKEDLVGVHGEVFEILWRDLKSQKDLSHSDYDWLVENLAKHYWTTTQNNQNTKLDDLCVELYSLGLAQNDWRPKWQVEKALENVYRLSGKTAHEAIGKLRFAREIHKAALDQPSKDPATKEQLEASAELRYKNYPSTCLADLWEKWHAVNANSEVTCRLGEAAAKSLQYNNGPGIAEAARILQQMWDDCSQVFGETDPATLRAGIATAQSRKYWEHDSTALWKRMYDACCADPKLGPFHERSVELALCLGRAYCKWGPVKQALKLQKDLDKGLRNKGEGIEAIVGIVSEKDLRQYVDVACLSIFLANNQNKSVRVDPHVAMAIAHSESCLHFALVRTSAQLGPENDLVFRILRDLRRALEFQHKNSDIEQVFQNVWEARSSKTAWASDNMSRVGDYLAQIYFESGRNVEAVQLMRQLCEHEEALHGFTDDRTLERYNRLSSCYSAQGKFVESLAIHRRALVAFGVPGEDLDDCEEPPQGRSQRSNYYDKYSSEDEEYPPPGGVIRMEHNRRLWRRQLKFRHGRGQRDGDHYSSYTDPSPSAMRTPSVRRLFNCGFRTQFVLEQYNLYGRALERLGRWTEAEHIYQNLWDECRRASNGGRSWMAHKFDNIEAWWEDAKARKVGEVGLWQRRAYY